MSSRIEHAYQAARNTVKAEVRAGAVVWKPRGRLENFLTELVALAILDEPGPMKAVLGESGVVDDPAPIHRIRPYTQQAIWESGRRKRRAIDLVLVLERGDREAEVWLEVKAGSGFSGDQMTTYLDAIRDAADGASRAGGREETTWRRLAVLAPAGIDVPYEHRDGVPVRLISWDQLVDAARAPEASQLWDEVASFVAEQDGLTRARATTHVAQEPTDADVGWLAEVLAHALGPDVPHDWLTWSYARDFELRRGSLRRYLAKRRDSGQPLEVFRQGQRGGLVAVKLGFAPGTTSLRVQLWVTADYFVPHRVLRRRATTAGLTDGWQLGGPDDSEILSLLADPAMRPGESTPDAAGDWLCAKLAALDAGDLLLDLDGNGRPTVSDD